MTIATDFSQSNSHFVPQSALQHEPQVATHGYQTQQDSEQQNDSRPSVPQLSEPSDRSPQPERTPKQRPPARSETLRGRLLKTILPAVLIPLTVASIVGYVDTQKRSRETSLLLLEEESILTAEATTVFLRDTFKIPEVVGLNPLVLDAITAADQLTEKERLNEVPIDRLESQYSATKLIQTNTLLNQYLSNVIEAEKLAEMFITNRHGYNVAYSNPTSDFVQRDEVWWQNAQEQGFFIEPPEFDESANELVVAMSRVINDPNTGKFLGVIKTGAPLQGLEGELITYLQAAVKGSRRVQLIDIDPYKVIDTITPDGASNQAEVIGGEIMYAIGTTLWNLVPESSSPEQIAKTLKAEFADLRDVTIDRFSTDSGDTLTAIFQLGPKHYSVTTIPTTNWLAIASLDEQELNAAAFELATLFSITGLILAVFAVGIILRLTQQLSRPLTALSQTAETMAAGDLDLEAPALGTVETQNLAGSFNNLVQRVKGLLEQQRVAATEQQQQREELEGEISSLMENIEGAVDGDLTVRAQLMAGEVGIVADLFNAVIESLQDTARQVRQSSSQVTHSLNKTEVSIQGLADQAIVEAEQIQESLTSVAQMAESAQTVATNAGEAATIANVAFETVQAGNVAMDQTVTSILGLRSTVGDTAKKMKRLGESAQKISQVVALIDEIALKTNLLSVNASVEAARAGELGQGFTAVAEQVGALAEQSAAATKEIAHIVAGIQTETQELVEAMEVGTSQVVDSTKQVETTKQRLADVLAKSQEIDQLMRSISQATTTQTQTAQNVTLVMQQITESSKQRSMSSREVAQAMQSTAQVAQALQSSVEQFKVDHAAVEV